MTTAIRRRPAISKIVDYWQDNAAEAFPDSHAAAIGWGEPFCLRCGWLAPLPEQWDGDPWIVVGGWLELAHLQNHAAGGSAEPSNMVPLCPVCHHAMPEFPSGRDDAIAWVRAGHPVSCPSWWQTATDIRWGGNEFVRYPGWTVLFRFYVAAAEIVDRHARAAVLGAAA